MYLKTRFNHLDFGVHFDMKKFDFLRKIGIYFDFIKKPNNNNLNLNKQIFYSIWLNQFGFLRFKWKFSNFNISDSKFSFIYENKSKPSFNFYKSKNKSKSIEEPKPNPESPFDIWFNEYCDLLSRFFYFKAQFDLETKSQKNKLQVETLLPISETIYFASKISSDLSMQSKMRIDVNKNLGLYYGVNVKLKDLKKGGTQGLIQSLFEQKFFNFGINYEI
jgi:hypothetical protein